MSFPVTQRISYAIFPASYLFVHRVVSSAGSPTCILLRNFQLPMTSRLAVGVTVPIPRLPFTSTNTSSLGVDANDRLDVDNIKPLP